MISLLSFGGPKKPAQPKKVVDPSSSAIPPQRSLPPGMSGDPVIQDFLNRAANLTPAFTNLFQPTPQVPAFQRMQIAATKALNLFMLAREHGENDEMVQAVQDLLKAGGHVNNTKMDSKRYFI